MIRHSPARNAFVLVAATCAALWGLWGWLLLAPDEVTRLRDDAFYEFAWAANVAMGRGPTVSDGVTTSGVQLLWSLLLVPIAWISPLLLPSLAPFLGLAFHVATAWVVRGFSIDRVVGWSLALCWLGHPLLLREAQNGQETAMAAFFAAALWRARGVRERWYLPLSLLAVLARSDLFALVVVMSFCRRRRDDGSLRVWSSLPTPLLAFLLPLVINLALGGSWLPDSALPMSWLWHSNHALTDESFWARQWWFSRPVLLGGPFAMASTFGYGLLVFQLVRPWWPKTLRAFPAMMVGILSTMGVHDLLTAGWAALLLALFPAVRKRKLPCEMLTLTIGLVAIVFVHWAVRWYPRDYYLAPLVVGAFVAMARYGRWRSFLFLFAVVQIQDSWRVLPEPLWGQAEMRLAGQNLHQVLPPGERVGCFNSGIVTFYQDVLPRAGVTYGGSWMSGPWMSDPSTSDPSTLGGGNLQRTVPRGIVNLDGVVDHRSFAALREDRLTQWLDEQGIRFLLDGPRQFSADPLVPHASGMHFGGDFDASRDLVEIARFVVPAPGLETGTAGMRLYWRRGRGELPTRSPVWDGVWRMPSMHYADSGATQFWWGARAGQSAVITFEDGRRTVLVSADVKTAVMFEMHERELARGRFEPEPR